MAFTLKVIDDQSTGLIVPNDQHYLGGVDLLQRTAFAHLFPCGYCEWTMRSLLYDLASLHDWSVDVAVRKAPPKKDDTVLSAPNGVCRNCGGALQGDGFSTVLHCESADPDSYEHHEPDANPVLCRQNPI